MAQVMASKDNLSKTNHEQPSCQLFKCRLGEMYDLSMEILNEKNPQKAQGLMTGLLKLIRCTRGEVGDETPLLRMQVIAESFKAHTDICKETYDAADARGFLMIMECALGVAMGRTLCSGSVRPATLDDLQDLPLVCVGGISNSPVFQLQRPNYNECPGPPLRYFKLQILNAFLNRNPIFVSEDFYDPSEQEEFPKTLPQRCLRARKDGRVVVGIAIITGLEEEPLSNGDKAYLEYLKEDVQSLSEDRDMGALESYRMQTEAVKSEYFKGSKFKVDTLAVLRTYQGRGHGTSLLDACVKRAESYSGTIAGSFTPWSKNIARRAGFNIKYCPVKHGESSFVMALGIHG